MRIRSAAVALACAASILRWVAPVPSLRIYDESNTLLATIAVNDGFTLSFIHSINLTPVDEEFTASPDGFLTLERVLFDQLSTGMPSGDEDGFSIVDGRFATTPHRRFREIAVRVSPVPGHRLSVGSLTHPLTRWAPTGGLLTVRAAERYRCRTASGMERSLQFSNTE